jgi:hypothetical protein
MDKNGVEKIKDVFGAVGNSGGDCDDIQVNCQEIDNYKHCDGEYCRNGDGGYIPHSCNARIDEEYIRHFNDDEMQFYECTITVETPESMYGEYWLTVQAEDMDGLKGIMDEKEYWFLNPVIALSLEGYMDFENVRPGTDSYASTMLVGNDADAGSGVLLDMFITGTDFYDSSASGAMCPTTNKLGLSAFRYFATNGAYSTSFDSEVDDVDGDRDKDAEGYVNVEYGKGWNDPKPFYNNAEILQAGPMIGPYWAANILAPGSEMAITFKLSLPEPCNGDFDTGSIYFWGEAI